MAEDKKNVIIDGDRCKGCGVCVSFCVAQCLFLSRQVNGSGFNTADKDTKTPCKGCGFCQVMCPDAAVRVTNSSQT